MKASQILYSTKTTQCFGTINSRDKRCALGVLFDAYGGIYNDGALHKVKKLLGSEETWIGVRELNDLGFSFKEIGDWLKSRGL